MRAAAARPGEECERIARLFGVSRCGLRRRGPLHASHVSTTPASCQSLRAAAARPASAPRKTRRASTWCQSLRAAAARPASRPFKKRFREEECQSLRAAAARPAFYPRLPTPRKSGVSRCGLRRRGPLENARWTDPWGTLVSVVAGCGGAARTTSRYICFYFMGVSRCGLRRRGPHIEFNSGRWQFPCQSLRAAAARPAGVMP